MLEPANSERPHYMTTKGYMRLSMELAYQAYLHRRGRQHKTVNRRLTQLADMLHAAKIVPCEEPLGQIHLGSTVTVQKSGSCLQTYTIVTPAEANEQTNCISDRSSLGHALLNHKLDDVVSLPNRDRQHRLLILAVA